MKPSLLEVQRKADAIMAGFGIKDDREDDHFMLGITDAHEGGERIWPSEASMRNRRLEWAYRTGLEVGRALMKEPAE